MNKGCINMLKKRMKNGFTLVELLAVIVILAVVILIAVTSVIPRMNNAKKKALIDEALMYLNAAKESLVFEEEQVSSCINISNLNGKYINKSSESYSGIVKNEYVNGVLTQTVNLTDGKFYVVGVDNLTSSDVKSTMPKGFASSCSDYNPILAEGSSINTLGYKLLMNEGGTTIDDNLTIINQRSSVANFTVIENDSSKSGIYKSEDDDGASFYYRGVVNNNWLEFGGFYWRIIRINGDGSIRLIYSGLKNTNHAGSYSAIKDSENNTTMTYSNSVSFTTNTTDITGLTSDQIQTTYSNGQYGHTYVGYMYNPKKIIAKYHDDYPTNSKRVNRYPLVTNISETKNDYYFFKNFDLDSDCFVGNASDDSGTCTLKCRTLGEDCIVGNWNTIATTEGNYSSTANGIYPATNPTINIYISPYKYTCWSNGTPVIRNNSDGTQSVYISCPLVSEIVGTINDQPKQARANILGLFAPTAEDANTNLYDSNVKKELDYWYEHTIKNIKDDENTYYLEDYISDGIFCNDRTSSSAYPITGSGGNHNYSSNTRNTSTATYGNPSLKCPNMQRDAFTLGSLTYSNVSHIKNVGNKQLKYPVGLITMDEIIFAGGKYNVTNDYFYLKSGVAYYTMTPHAFAVGSNTSNVWYIGSSGKIAATVPTNKYYVRPVINLKASVLYDSGSGTEADPYKVKLAS